MEGSGEGSEEASEGENDGRGAPFCGVAATRQHMTRELEQAAVTMARSRKS
jgi:hypothetical protein